MKILLFVFFTVFGFTGFSQNNSLGKSDPAAKIILDNVSAKFKTYKTVTANFTLTITNGNSQIQDSKKGMIYLKGSRYKVNVSDQVMYSDGSNIWTFDKSAREVQITKFDPGSNMVTPQMLFTDFYDTDFLYKLNGETRKNGKIIQEIELTPVDKTKAFFKILVEIDKASKSILSTKVFDKNGNRYAYTITSMKVNSDLPDSLFIFNPKNYPGVEVVDLR